MWYQNFKQSFGPALFPYVRSLSKEFSFANERHRNVAATDLFPGTPYLMVTILGEVIVLDTKNAV